MSQGNAAGNFKKADYDRAAEDWYVEPAWCVELLADAIDFDRMAIWDPCCGGGNIPDVFNRRGRFAIGTDLVDRGYRHFSGVHDATSAFLPGTISPDLKLAVVMNPPFKLAEAITRRMLALTDQRVAVLQQLSWLASQGRNALFTEFPPSDVLVLSSRPSMPPGTVLAEKGEAARKSGTTDFCWIVWTRPHDRQTRLRWIDIDRSPSARGKPSPSAPTVIDLFVSGDPHE